MTAIHYRAVDVCCCGTASHRPARFRDLIPLLADRIHLVAPDLPGFGRSEIKPRVQLTYSQVWRPAEMTKY